jgi:hypothetical protein
MNDQRAIQQAAEQSDSRRDDDSDSQHFPRRRVDREPLQHRRGTERRQREDRADRDIDPARYDHERRADGHDRVHAHWSRDAVDQVVEIEKRVRAVAARLSREDREAKSENNDDDDEPELLHARKFAT